MDELEQLTAEDIYFLNEKGISTETIRQQLNRLREGFPRLEIVRPATLHDGIRKLTPEEELTYARRFESAMAQGRAMKFVPASGAATRMFKDLIRIYKKLTEHQPLNDEEHHTLERFLTHLSQFAFVVDLAEVLKANGYELTDLQREGRADIILRYLLTADGLNYSELPKALLKFHRYDGETRTPLEEHLVEGAGHVKDQKGTVRIHFTVPARFREAIQTYVQKTLPRYRNHARHFALEYSVQDPATDTIAVDLQNRIVRDERGKPLFRPAGHGALLKNLNDLQGDIIFIKNIDNVVPDHLKPTIIHYKKVLGGLLVEVQEKIFSFLRALQANPTIDVLNEAIAFLDNELHLSLPQELQTASFEKRREYVFRKLNRPIRVCGIVENRGEPGGGPFWVKTANGELSLQIVESAQVDKNDPVQREIWESSTHFNPTDLVCGVRDYTGKPFDLMQYRDTNAGIITVKYWQGKEIKILELPGLWNGSMAYWNTIFVEVPLETFNPVKTVFDLLRPEHLPPHPSQNPLQQKVE